MGRRNGSEQKYSQRQNERKMQGAESYTWGVDDIKCTKQETEKRKIRVQIENEKRKGAGWIDCAQSLQLLGNGGVPP